MRITVKTADITTLEVDTIVNAANPAMTVGAGVDGAIHAAAGYKLANYSAAHHVFGCPTGMVRRTPAFDLPSHWIFHTVGPDTREYDAVSSDDLLASCYYECMKRAIAENVPTIAFPAISTGVYGFDKAKAATIAMSVLDDFRHFDIDVTFACFCDEDTAIIQTELDLDVWEVNND